MSNVANSIFVFVKMLVTFIFISSHLYNWALQFQTSIDLLSVILDFNSKTRADAYTLPSFLFVNVNLN